MNPNTIIGTNPASPGCQFSLPEGQYSPRSSTPVTWRMPRALLSIGLALCGVSATFAQSLPPWDLEPVDDIVNGSASKMTADRAGNVFVAGSVSVAGVPHTCLTRGSNQGDTWTSNLYDLVDAYIGGIAAATIEIAPAQLQDQLVMVARASTAQWTTQRSLDAGETWATVDSFTPASIPGYPSGCTGGVAIDSAGNIYVAGYSRKTITTVVKNKTSTSYAWYWVVRKIPKDATAAKTTFELPDTVSPIVGSWPIGVTCVGTNVFVAGNSGDRWQVRKYSGSGATWELVDNFRYDPNYPSTAKSITADGAGNLYVVGWGTRPVGSARLQATAGYWIVRKGTGVGAGSFQPLDTFEFETNKGAIAHGVSVDPVGNVHVTGFAGSTVGSYVVNHWITRRLPAGSGGTWENTDHYFLSSSNTASGYRIVADSAGNVFAAGNANDGTINHNWMVRRQLAPLAP